MEVVITHLTRMAKGFCCAAGIELITGNSVRMLQRPYTGTDSRLTTSYLWLSGGPFKIGNVVELGRTIPCPNPPESEDHWFNPANARLVSVHSPIQFWSLLLSKSKSSLTEIFGISPKRRRVSLFIGTGQGTKSLGFYPLQSSGKLAVTAGLGE